MFGGVGDVIDHNTRPHHSLQQGLLLGQHGDRRPAQLQLELLHQACAQLLVWVGADGVDGCGWVWMSVDKRGCVWVGVGGWMGEWVWMGVDG